MSTTQAQTQLGRLEQMQAQALLRAKVTLDAAEREQRTLTGDEEKVVNEAMRTSADLDKRIAALMSDAAFGDQVNKLVGGGGTRSVRGAGSWSEQFLAGGAGDFFKSNGHRRGGSWASPSVEILHASTLTEDPASGGSVVPPDTLPFIVSLPQRRLVVADLLAPGTTTSNNVQFMAEKQFDNAAAAVSEGAPKPESGLTFELKNAPVRKLAHWIPVTEEILEDQAQMRSFIDQRLRLGVQLVEDEELLNGSGIAPHLLGLMAQAGAPDVVRGASESDADAIARAISQIAVTSGLQPDGVILNPADFLAIQLSKADGTGEYLSGAGPFVAPGPAFIWGLPAALTTAIAPGVALIGAYKLATQIFRHGGIRIDATNSHSDFFIKNLVAIRGEERLALAVYRASALGKVVGLNPAIVP